MNTSPLTDAAARIHEVVGPKGLVTDAAALTAMSTAWRDHYPSLPALVVQPGSVAEVQAVVKICAKEKLPIVPQGGNTGMTGAALARDGGRDIVLSLRRLNRIRAIDSDDDMMVAEAGCILSEVKAAAQAVNRLFPLSLGAQGSCTIGGNIASNAGGINALRYGPMRSLVAGLEVVLPDGSLWQGLRALRKDNAGYDLKQLFIGSEGTLGIITAAVLKLSALPVRNVTVLVGVETPEAALAWFRRLREGLGEQLTACELIERICIDAACRHLPGAVDPLAAAYPWYVLAEAGTQSHSAGLEDQMAELFGQAFDAGEVLDGTVASSGSQAGALWSMRENLAEAHKREGISFKHDISVPTSKVPLFLATADHALRARFPGIRPFSFGHLGDGNIHYNPLQAAGEPREMWAPRLGEINRIVHDVAVSLGGSITAEHGVGQLRREELLHYKAPVEIALMEAVKRALDPQGILNPGKLFMERGATAPRPS